MQVLSVTQCSGLPGRQRQDHDDRQHLSLGHKLRGDPQHLEVRTHHQVRQQQARDERRERPQGPADQRAAERDQEPETQAGPQTPGGLTDTHCDR